MAIGKKQLLRSFSERKRFTTINEELAALYKSLGYASTAAAFAGINYPFV